MYKYINVQLKRAKRNRNQMTFSSPIRRLYHYRRYTRFHDSVRGRFSSFNAGNYMHNAVVLRTTTIIFARITSRLIIKHICPPCQV